MKYYSTEFNILSENGFTNTYRCVMDAMRYYDSDCGVCCSQFRKALESVINDIYNLYGYLAGGYSNKQDIDGLRYVIPEPFYDDKIIFELNNLRNIGNAYAHFNGDEVRDAYNDRLTCYVAIKEISSWLVGISSKARSREKREERKSKKFWKTVDKVLIGTAVVVAAIWGERKFSVGINCSLFQNYCSRLFKIRPTPHF